jgi:hypothetical protein
VLEGLDRGGCEVSKIEKFGQTQNVSVTVLVDNRADLIVKSTDTVKRFTDQPLLAEHGFAALVELKDIGVPRLRCWRTPGGWRSTCRPSTPSP